MSTLTELLRDVADHQPDDGFADPASLTTLGRGRLRRRRTTAGLVAVAVMVAVAAPFAIRAASGPTPPQPTGKVISLDSAVRGVAGRDYAVLSSVTTRMLTSRHLAAQGTLPDGRLVVSRLEGPRAQLTGDGVFDPRTQALTWFPHRHVGLYLGRDGDLLVYGTPNSNEPNPNVAPDIPYRVYDLGTGTWRDLPTNREVDLEWGGSYQSQVVSDGMLYVGMDTSPTRPLWRVSLDGIGGWQQVGTVSAFGAGGKLLAFTVPSGRRSTPITLRDITTDDATTIAGNRLPSCSPMMINVSTTYLVEQLSCGRPLTGVVSRLLVLDHNGKSLATIRAGDMTVEVVTDSSMTFSVPPIPGNDGYPPGTYTYYPASGRLVRLGPHAVPRASMQRPPDPVQLWEIGLSGHERPGAIRFEVVVPR